MLSQIPLLCQSQPQKNGTASHYKKERNFLYPYVPFVLFSVLAVSNAVDGKLTERNGIVAGNNRIRQAKTGRRARRYDGTVGQQESDLIIPPHRC
jgi:hypothetical protein